ncbi:MAG: flagellin lysine-N-methylase [Candidatus Sedimenticola sp. (ex Thyasira tokunagai)]
MKHSCRTPAYFAEFSCTGPGCPDTCCQAWDIVIDRGHYDDVRKRMTGVPKNAALFERYVVVNDQSSESRYARVTMRENGFCPMLKSDGLCLIHDSYGIDKLWNVCTMYPRVLSKNVDHYEMAGALSCPEVVRLCLEDETPLKTVDYPLSSLPRPLDFPLYREIDGTEQDPYIVNFARVRDALMLIMGDEEEALEARLFHLATLANQLSSFYFRRCPTPDRVLLSTTLAKSLTQEERQRCAYEISHYQADEPLAISLIIPILQLLQQHDAALDISQLFNTIEEQHPAARAGEFLDAEYFRQEISNRLTSLDKGLLRRIDRGINRYIINCLYRESFITMPCVQEYLQPLLVRATSLRFLLLMHPTLNDIESIEEIDKLLVQVISNFCRNIDQSQSLLKVIYDALADQQLLGYEYAPGFICLTT